MVVRIMVVEDDYYTASDLAAQLQHRNVEVVGPFSLAADARAQAASRSFDAAILDVNLCGDSVFPLARFLHDSGIPFVFATGYERRAMPEQFAAVPHFEKPFNNERCIETVLELVAGRKG